MITGPAIVLTNGWLNNLHAKTCHGLLRTSDRFEVLGVIDRKFAGKDAGEVMDGKRRNIAVYADIPEALEKITHDPGPRYAIVGVAVHGGKLPDSLRKRIRLTMTRRTREGLTIAGAVSLGTLVALLEFPCTGQVYGPIIWHIAREPAGALGWLLLYNLFFILPLVVVFLCILFGLRSGQLTAFFQRHLATVKFALAGLFLLLAVTLVLTMPAGA